MSPRIRAAGVDLGGGAPPEAKAALAAELAPAFKTARREYLESNYSARSLADAVRQLLPKAQVTAIAGTGAAPSEPKDILARSASARRSRRRRSWSVRDRRADDLARKGF